MTQFSLTWDAHRQNICNGLSSLQQAYFAQNGEFVDMTLAADGHHVLVHRMVLSLVSPYIKELLASAQCQHPVIFLNKISYSTLRAMLEYIYTGEVRVAKEELNELIYAGKELHIRGLEEMAIEATLQDVTFDVESNLSNKVERASQAGLENKMKISSPNVIKIKPRKENTQPKDIIDDSNMNDNSNVNDDSDHNVSDGEDAIVENQDDEVVKLNINKMKSIKEPKISAPVQYTTSNQGQIQLILNRFMYSLKYTSRSGKGDRKWRCVHYRDKKCPAGVFTRDDVVLQRFAAHNHGFLDKKILKKVRDKAVYSAIKEAEEISIQKKNKEKVKI